MHGVLHAVHRHGFKTVGFQQARAGLAFPRRELRPITSERELDVLYADEAHAELEINQPGDGLFEVEIGELMDLLEDVRGRARKRVLNTLGNATRIIAAQILYGGRELDLTLERLDPVWDWLFAQHDGLLQVDDRGYYDADKLILEVD
jgi:hypothetical protein